MNRRRAPVERPKILIRRRRAPVERPKILIRQRRAPVERPKILIRRRRAPVERPKILIRRRRAPVEINTPATCTGGKIPKIAFPLKNFNKLVAKPTYRLPKSSYKVCNKALPLSTRRASEEEAVVDNTRPASLSKAE